MAHDLGKAISDRVFDPECNFSPEKVKDSLTKRPAVQGNPFITKLLPEWPKKLYITRGSMSI